MRVKAVLMIMLALAPLQAAGVTQDELLARLRLDHAVLLGAESDYRRQRESGTLRGIEAGDYAAYVARLRRRVIEDCAELARLAASLPAGLPCPAIPSADTRSAAIDQQAEQTRAERIAGMDAEFSAGLGEYDEMLLREQERVRAAATRREAGAGGGAAGQGAGEAGSGGNGAERTGDAADGEPEKVQGGGANAEDTGSGTGRGAEKTSRSAVTPPDIPDGSDDDVVARQLREAAEKETDPQLRAKLWDEYRKYKRGTRQAGVR